MTSSTPQHPKIGFDPVASSRVVRYCRHSLLVYFYFVFLCTLPSPADAQAQLDGDDIQALTARTVLGIISYAKWPIQPAFYRLCVVGDGSNLRLLSEPATEVAGHEIRLSTPILEGESGVSACDIVYFGAMLPEQRQEILKQTTQAPILTLGEGDAMCADGMMFCFGSNGQQTVLQANLDAIARSGIKINANVLLLLRNRGKQP